MKLLQSPKVSTNEMKELEGEGIEKDEEELIERNTINLVIKKAKINKLKIKKKSSKNYWRKEHNMYWPNFFIDVH